MQTEKDFKFESEEYYWDKNNPAPIAPRGEILKLFTEEKKQLVEERNYEGFKKYGGCKVTECMIIE